MTTTTAPATPPSRVDALDGLLDMVSGDRMAGTVARLAGEDFTGRRVGSAGGAAARAWLARRLADLGAAVTTEPFPVPSVPEVYAQPTVRWYDGTTTTEPVFGQQLSVHLASADVPLVRRGGLAVAGTGDPGGRWLIVPAGMSLSDAYGHAEGALGLLVVANVDGEGWQYTMLAGPNRGPLPVLTVDPATHTALHTASTTDGAWLAANAPVRRVDVTAANLHGRWPTAGTDEAVEVLLTAHFDGVGDHPGLRQPGAADNGSGVAVVLEAARVLASAPPTRVALAVAFLDGEETGALGSAQHARRLAEAGQRPVVINVDGAGHLHEAAAVEAGGPAHGLLAVLDQAARHTGLPLAAGPVASDNRRYAAAGLPALGIGAGMAGYHSPADTPERVQTATMTALARLGVATVWFATASGATLSSLIGD
ncbi:M28 family metallopeptidase [Phytohabitans aurantiacus]|uniref:Peptidase M28 domain-containing protein n=1 Tax=Phytohabitans aurantiacus TaxID=3016789 RepID=A0ABQ5QNQ7_9ACTN|nr:M28 family peptidase [Phytohabitans aurantiacus]GLH95384.1 hypothetical protein Pa4123_06560 [Phytohabitans aurantiacus]